jgi:hypothetical protein
MLNDHSCAHDNLSEKKPNSIRVELGYNFTRVELVWVAVSSSGNSDNPSRILVLNPDWVPIGDSIYLGKLTKVNRLSIAATSKYWKLLPSSSLEGNQLLPGGVEGKSTPPGRSWKETNSPREELEGNQLLPGGFGGKPTPPRRSWKEPNSSREELEGNQRREELEIAG